MVKLSLELAQGLITEAGKTAGGKPIVVAVVNNGGGRDIACAKAAAEECTRWLVEKENI